MSYRLVIFGASGDLTSRKLMPALAQLHEVGQLPPGFSVLGIARDDWGTHRLREALERYAGDISLQSRNALVSSVEYRRAEVTDPGQVIAALQPLREPIIAYLALPPRVFLPTLEALAGASLPQGSRVVIEKPFGEDLASAQALNRLLHQSFPENAVFRIDHFLHLQTVQNVLGLRFANRIFEQLWNRDHVERVEIVWDESLTLEGRASYYDRAGALKDMIQNHLLQLLCLVGMEPPLTLDERTLRDRKIDVLRAVRRLSPQEVERYTVRARYSAGRIGECQVPNYADEEGIDPARGTETFAQVTLWVDNWRWAGVPFVLHSGKALGRERREIAVHFWPVPHLAFEANEPPPNVLRLLLQPDRLAFDMNLNRPGTPFPLERIELGVDFTSEGLPAYARLLLQVLEGDCTLSIRDDEAEESWRVITPILDAWSRGRVPLLEYPAGSDGPTTATQPPGGQHSGRSRPGRGPIPGVG
jgi:glucose-6-phosphate 1-dehydrogenase